MTGRQQRLLGIAGIAFVVLVLVSVFGLPSPPNTHASAAKVVSYYHKHKAALQFQGYVTELAVFLGVGFFWYLRDHLAAVTEYKPLATVGFAGALLFAVSGGLAAGISWTLADAVDHVDPTVMQTLNVLASDLGNGITGVGAAIFLAATGIVVIRSGVLPRWLGWVGVVFAVAALVIGFLGLAGIGIWLLIASVLFIVRADRAVPAAAV